MLPEYAEDVRSDALGVQITPPGKQLKYSTEERKK